MYFVQCTSSHQIAVFDVKPVVPELELIIIIIIIIIIINLFIQGKKHNQIKIHKNMQNICSYLWPCLRHKSKLVKWYTIPKEKWKNEIEIKTQYPDNASSTK